jgi:hypothetical protein
VNSDIPIAGRTADRAASSLTHVELTFIPKRVEFWIRFGHIAEERTLDRRRRVVSFASNRIFALVRWAANEHGTIISRIDILRTVSQGEAYSTVPFVRPGGDILLRLNSWPRVERALRAIDTVEAIGIDPADAAPDYWQHVHNRLTVGSEPRAYTRQRHDAWLLRQKVMP